MTTFAPDTPHHVLSDWAEEHASDYGLTAERNANGELILTVPAKPNGLPDWETFLRVCHDLRAADAWVMEGAEPDCPRSYYDTYDWFQLIKGVTAKAKDLVVYDVLRCCKNNATYTHYEAALADLSRACVAYARSGESNE